MPRALTETEPRGLDKKRTVVLLRSVVVISTSYLILFGPEAARALSIAYILALIVSNIGLALTPRKWFHHPVFSGALLLGDTLCVLVGLYLTVGCFSQDFLIIYFFTIFLTTATQGVAQIAAGAAMVSGLYGYWLWISSGHMLGSAEWLRLPFFFIVAVFYAYMTEETKQERWRRQQAERESEHLRFLLNLGDTFAARPASRELIEQIGPLIESELPRLHCTLASQSLSADAPGVVVPLRAHGESYGALWITARDGRPLGADEEQFCRLVGALASNAVYTTERLNAASENVRIKQQFLGTLSHELRTPLHAILGYTEIIDSTVRESGDAFACESLDRLQVNAARLQSLVDELLLLAQLRAGERSVEVETVDLRAAFTELAAHAAEQLRGRPIQFEYHVAAGVPTLRTDGRKLMHILKSLLSNAAKFTQEGSIRLMADRAGDRAVEIAVRDSGIGIDPAQLHVIFEAFHQVDASLTRRFQGLGLGLALAQELAAVLGGRIDVQSEVGRGTTFRVRVPIVLETARQGVSVEVPLRQALLATVPARTAR